MRRRHLEGVPQSSIFDLWVCGNPECGPHLLIYSEDRRPICELVIFRDRTVDVIKGMQHILYAKVVEEDE